MMINVYNGVQVQITFELYFVYSNLALNNRLTRRFDFEMRYSQITN